MKKLLLSLAALITMSAIVLTGCQQPSMQPSSMNDIINQGSQTEVDLSGMTCTEDITVSRAVTINNGDFGGKTLTVNVSGVTLKNAKNVNVVVAEAVGDGDFTVVGSEVSTLKILGGGANSIHVKDTAVSVINVAKSNVRVALEGKSNIAKLQIQKGIAAKVEVNSSDVKIQAAEVVAENGSKVEGENVQITVAAGITFTAPAGTTTDTKPAPQNSDGKKYTYNETLSQIEKQAITGLPEGVKVDIYAYGDVSDSFVVGVCEVEGFKYVTIKYEEKSVSLQLDGIMATSFEPSKTYTFVLDSKKYQLDTSDSVTGYITVTEKGTVDTAFGQYTYNESLTLMQQSQMSQQKGYTVYCYGEQNDFYMITEFKIGDISNVSITKSGISLAVQLQLDGSNATAFTPSTTYTFTLNAQKYQLVTSNSLTGSGLITVIEKESLNIPTGNYTFNKSIPKDNINLTIYYYKNNELEYQIWASDTFVQLREESINTAVFLQINGSIATKFEPSTTYTFVVGKKTYQLVTGSTLNDSITVTQVNS